MLIILLIFVALLLITGNINIPGIQIANPTLFYALGHSFTLFNLLLLILVIWSLSFLGGFLRDIVAVLIFLWVLSLFGIVITSSFSSLLVLAIVLGIVLHILGVI